MLPPSVSPPRLPHIVGHTRNGLGNKHGHEVESKNSHTRGEISNPFFSFARRIVGSSTMRWVSARESLPPR